MTKKKDKTIYTDESIISLDPREFTRLRPSTYLGDNAYSTQLVREIFANALDEHNIGHGNEISIDIDTKQHLYQVKDNGQGFPINVTREDGKTILEAAFSVLNTSGKYDDSKDAVYSGSSLGVNGIGSKLTNYLSHWLTVTSYRDNEYEYIAFDDGVFSNRLVGKLEHESGTLVTWCPDEQFFQNVDANKNDLEKLFEGIAALCPQLTIKFSWDGKETIYHSANGIQDLLDEKVKEKEVLQSRFAIRKVVDSNLFDVAVTYTSDYSDTTIAYVNYGLTESGAHISAVKYNMTKQINKYALDNGFIKKEGDGFSSSELSEGLVLVFNLKATNVKYDSQTKIRVTDCDKTLILQVINNDFPVWLSNNPKDAKMIIDRALLARKAKDAAQKAKDGIRNAKAGGKKFISLPTKLVDAYSKDRSECELFICLKGDTEVKLLNGTQPKIEDLVGQTDLWAYSTNENGSMIPAKIKSVFKTQDVTKLLKLTFNDGSSIECTPEHRFLDKETLSWVEAKDLCLGQSLCSMKFKNVKGYENVYIQHGQDYTIDNHTQKKYFHGQWEPTHIRAARLLGLAHAYDGGTVYDIHHIDHNKLNNDPSNLLVCTKSEHTHIHNVENYEYGEFKKRLDNMSEDSRDRMRNGVYNRTEAGIQHQKDAVSQAWEDGRYKNATFANFNNSEKRRVNGKDYTQMCKILKFAKSLLDKNIEVNELNWEQYRCKERSKADVKFKTALKYFSSLEQLIEEAKNYNLSITAIETIYYGKPIPVYCLNIDNDFHSFVLGNGLITHNCEGDSAANGLIAKRDGKTQAVFPIRGKILSCRKATPDKVYANQEISNIVKALGLDIDKETGKLVYDKKKLRYNKIVLATDADPDGAQIKLLLITMFWWLCPELVINGHIAVAVPPLFRITTKKNEYIYLKDQDALDKYKKEHAKESYLVNRMKGLGEMDPSELAYCLLNTKSRIVSTLDVLDINEADKMLEYFMGDKVEPRRDYLLAHAGEVEVDRE